MVIVSPCVTVAGSGIWLIVAISSISCISIFTERARDFARNANIECRCFVFY